MFLSCGQYSETEGAIYTELLGAPTKELPLTKCSFFIIKCSFIIIFDFLLNDKCSFVMFILHNCIIHLIQCL